MGSIFGGGSQTQSSSSAPWAVQQPYIENGFQQAQNIFGQQQASGPYTGQLYAPINATQSQAINAGTNLGEGLYGQGATVANTGQNALGVLPGAQGVAGNYSTGNFNQGSTGALNYAAGNTPLTVNASNSGILSALNMANQDPTAQNEADAASYANNPVIQQQIQAALQPIQDTLTMQTLPSLNARAVAGGNVDSSRAGAAEGLAQLAAQQTAGQVASNIQGNAYNTGLQLAENGRVANMNGALSAATAANQGTGLGLTGQTSANNNNVANQGISLAGNNQLLQSIGLGSNLLGQGVGIQQQGVSDLNTAGGLLQQNQQNQLNANQQQWQNTANYPWTLLNNYMGVVGAKDGSTTTNTTTSSGNPLGGILSLGALAAAPFTGGASTSLLGAGISGLSGLFGGGQPTYNYGTWGD